MELNPGLSALFLLLLLATNGCSMRGNSEVYVLGSEVYEIDYRGPETHPSPPEERPFIHRQPKVMTSRQLKSQRYKARTKATEVVG